MAITALVLAGIRASAQQPSGFESISTDRGLSQGMVFTLLQDREGFLWVATKDGLNRYDGYNFKVFTNDPYDPWSLSNNSVRLLSEDSKGRIWVGMEDNSLDVYDKKTGRFYRLKNDAIDLWGQSNVRINQVLEVADGRMLLVSNNAVLHTLRLPDDYFEGNATVQIGKIDLPDSIRIKGLFTDRKGRTWVNSFNKVLYRFEQSNNSFVTAFKGLDITSIFSDINGQIWCSPGPFLWDGQSLHPLFEQVSDVGAVLLAPGSSTMWFVHNKGLRASDISQWRPGKPLSGKEPWLYDFPSLNLNVAIIERSGNIWVGTDGYGLLKLNLGRQHFRHEAAGFSVRFLLPLGNDDFLLGAYPIEWRRIKSGAPDSKPLNWLAPGIEVDAVLVSKSGEYYAWTNQGLIRTSPDMKTITRLPLIEEYGDKQPMFEDRQGKIWFAGYRCTLSRLNPANGTVTKFDFKDAAGPMLPSLLSTAFYEDGEGTFWIGTEEGFVRALPKNSDPADLQFTWFKNNPSDHNSLNYNHVSCLLDDYANPSRYLWICTKGGGLNRLDKKNGDFLHLTTKHGLPNDVVYGILFDDDGNLWGSTNRGIFCLSRPGSNLTNPEDLSNLMIRKFTKADGLQDNEFNTGAFAKLPNGDLAFGGVNGLNIFDPKKALSDRFAPNVFITGILVNNQPVLPGDGSGVLTQTIETSKSITLTHVQDILTLEFAALDFTNPTQNKYRYQLAGINDSWVEAANRRSATFLHLPPGNYTFRVQGSNSQGIWSDQTAELNINVLPPWWRTWWAYLGYLLMLGAGIREYFRFSVNRAKLKEQLAFETREAERVKELNAMKTQLYTNITHEFRTPLTVILGMAQQVLDKPADHFRSGLEMIIRNGNSLLKLVNEMLDLSKLESGKMALQLAQGDVLAFLRYLVESFRSMAESQGKQLHFLSEMDSLCMDYDQEKLRQIVSNLFSNALKFTPAGGNIYMSVSRSDEENLANLEIRVKDTGIGIPESQLPYIFDRFYQADNSHTRQGEGTGIGLALTRELVKLMEGEISVKSPPSGAKRGSEFMVTLPIRMNAETKMVKDEHLLTVKGTNAKDGTTTLHDASDLNANASLPLLLLVEDNADVVAYTASCLPDYRLVIGKDGQEGFNLATEMIPDLIISDVMMPIMDGFELCRRLKSDERTSHIPIIMLTAKADMDSKLEGLERGADVYLEKPFQKKELLVRIKNLLDLRHHMQQFYLKTVGLSKQSVTSTLLPLPTTSEDAFVKKVREVVEANYSDVDFNVEHLSKAIYLSPSQLQRKLVAIIGYPPIRFIRLVRLKKAQELLKNTDLSITAVSLSCGFSDPGYFARIFKQEFGKPPADWREEVHDV